MDPVTVTGAVTALGKVLVAGAAAYLAGGKPALDESHVAAIQAFLDGLDAASAALGSGGMPANRPAAQHVALIVQAFGAALDEHWAGNKTLAPGFDKPSGLRRLADWFSTDPAKERRRQDIESRLRMALDLLEQGQEAGTPAKTLEEIRVLTGDPLRTPIYRALWKAFTNPLLQDEEQPPLIDSSGPGAKLRFEADFHLAYAEALSSPVGRQVGSYLLSLGDTEPPRRLRRLTAEDLALSDRRPVFSTPTPGVPLMPLGTIYVEPHGAYAPRQRPQDEERGPIRTLVQDLLKKHKIVFVRGDFGMGKSLTARTLAWQWAKDYVEDTEDPSPDVVFPLLIKCARDFRHGSFDDTVRASLRHQAEAIGIELRQQDPAFAKPPDGARVVYLVDGLDEIVATPRELEEFLRDLDGATSDRHRAIVFSRKGALPPAEKLGDSPIVDVQPFQEPEGQPGQVTEWLNRWNQLSGKAPITVQDLNARGAKLLEIAVTPILLFMIAVTWREKQLASGETTLAALYETFFLQIGRGKCQQDAAYHPHVAEAANKLKEKLVEQKRLEKSAAETEAMMWLMARVAWAYRCCEYNEQSLDIHDVNDILRHELGLKGEMQALEIIRVGLLLVLQADLRGEGDKILFGHKSFREFLVARYWAERLRRILVAAGEENRRDIERELFGARLVQHDDESLDFLMQILHGSTWTAAERKQLGEWCERCFEDEAPDFGDDKRKAWRDDRRPLLRHAALAIRCLLRGLERFAPTENAFRSLLAWFWMRRELSRIVAPNLSAEGIHIVLAELCGANLSDASLYEASLYGASLSDASLSGANLSRADLSGANLAGATLIEANLSGANLAGATLIEVDLSGANLVGANLSGANLAGAYLFGAIFDGENLVGVNLSRAWYSRQTRWPAGFDPIEAGAIFVYDLKHDAD